ncbi:hypothetical protein [Novosphingobium clariflavum]|uniref:Large polyvalent protein associated domain-containing protein n=1 Tax=Novosphingobium clariflavum TaxID=2029884 RepID=A0ABV6S4K0_9SPHN|nr:hypothetical protein [Novosphingobium clariflavum]
MSTPFPELESYLPGARQPRQPSASAVAPTWLDREIERQRDEQIRDVLLSAPAPDAVARTEKLARDTGSSVGEVQGNEDAAQRGLQAKRALYLMQDNPALARWAGNNPRGMAMAADDYDNLSIFGKAWNWVTKVPGALRTSFDTMGVQGAKLNSIVYGAIGDAYAGLESIAQPGRLTVAETEARDAARAGYWDAGVANAEATTEAHRQRYNSYLQQTIVGQGLESLAPSLTAAAAGVVTRSPALATGLMATSVGGPAYYDARKKGLTAPEAARYAAVQGGTEYITERMPAGTLVDLIARKTPFGKTVMRELSQEIAGENLATIVQDLADWAYLPENKDKTVGDYLKARPQAALDTTLATIGGVAGNATIVGSVQRAADATASVAGRVNDARQARRERAFLDQAADATAASKLKQRDPESFRTLMREHAAEAGTPSVFIPGEAIRAYNQSEHYDPANDPLARPEAQEAAATGGDVVMPIEDFLTDVVGTPAWEAIRDDVRLTQGGMSTREAQTFEEAMDDIVGHAADELARSERADREARSVRDQLVDRVAGMFGQSFTSSVARQYAEIAVQRAQTRAQRLGMELTPQDLQDLAIRQVLPEGVAEAVSADRLDLVINALRAGGPAQYGVGPTLLEFIRQRGGVNDVGGDLASMGVPSQYLTGYDPRQSDMMGGVSGMGDFGLDNTLQAAITAGYFPDLVGVEHEQGPSTLDSQRLLDAIAEELAGRPAYAEMRTDDVRAHADDLRQMLEEAGYAPSNMTDEDIRNVVDAMARESATARDVAMDGDRSFNQAKSAERATPITRNADVTLPVTDITSEPVSFDEAKSAFASDVKPAKARMVSGEEVVFTQARKAIFSKSDHFNPALRFELIPHLPEIVANAASFATTTTGAQADHAYVHAAAHVRLNGRDISIRLVLKDVGDGTLRQYQVEGFEVTAAPTGMLRSEDLDTMAPAAAATRTVRDVAQDFKGRQLFQEARGRAIFGENGRIIELFASRDLSTPIHELGHVWLEELAADAALESAPDQLRADWDAVRSWFAHSGHAISEDGTIPTEAHELFARGIERYFMEGKAPTTALTRIFENVRQWMLSIYRSVAQLRSDITPEIREVFDRMLASDAEIDVARERQGIENLFKDAAEAGMSAAEFAAYQQRSQDASAASHAKLLERVMSTIRRRETERYREARRGVRAEEMERIDASPLFRALAAMDPKRDGNRIAFRPIADAQIRETDMLKDYYGRIKAVFEALPAEQAARWNDRMVLPFTDVETGNLMVADRQQLIAMALNVGNEGNLQRLADGYRVNGGALVGYLDQTLTQEEWQFVQGVWDTIDTLWPDISAMEKRVNGVAPDKVRARKFDTSTNGQMRGGYYPAIYDSTRDFKAEENSGKESDLRAAGYTNATTRSSSTKARDEQVKRPILLDLGAINRHLGEVIHDITHREAVIQAHRFLSSEKVRRAVNEALGPEASKSFRPWLKHVANSWVSDRAGNEGWAKAIRRMRANTTMVGMGFRATTIISQISGYANSAEVVGISSLTKAIAQVARDPVRLGKLVLEKSPDVRQRLDTMDRDIRAEVNRLAATNPISKLEAKVAHGKQFAFHYIGLMDRVVAIPTWLAGYNNAIEAGLSEDDAIYAGDKAVRASQGAGGPKDLAAVQRGTGALGEAGKLLTMFYSFLSMQYQRERSLARDVMGLDERTVRATPRLLARATLLFLVQPMLTEFLRGVAGGSAGPDDDEWWAQWFLRKTLANALGPIPVVRDVFEPAWNKARGQGFASPSITPVQRAYESVANVFGDVGRIARGEETKHATKNALEATGYVTGLVPGQIASATQFLVDWANGDADPDGPRQVLEGLSTGHIEE